MGTKGTPSGDGADATGDADAAGSGQHGKERSRQRNGPRNERRRDASLVALAGVIAALAGSAAQRRIAREGTGPRWSSKSRLPRPRSISEIGFQASKFCGSDDAFLVRVIPHEQFSVAIDSLEGIELVPRTLRTYIAAWLRYGWVDLDASAKPFGSSHRLASEGTKPSGYTINEVGMTEVLAWLEAHHGHDAAGDDGLGADEQDAQDESAQSAQDSEHE